jgi:hypothetical protein
VEGIIIKPSQKVGTLGSCFAQHLGRFIKTSGLNYFIPETGPPDLSSDESLRRNFGVFSARYGNVYTVRQAVQLFDRAFGAFVPQDDCWERNGTFVDAFRPQVEPDGFRTREELHADRIAHLGHVRRVFCESDFIIFTLGMTEGWRSRLDGAVYPVAPGVSGGGFDPTKYEFVNFTPEEVQNDLSDFLTRVNSVNPRVTFILTVSPVSIIATYERRHVLVSNTYSKAALRVAADVMERKFRNAIYFPGYEIITSPAAQGRYYADDFRVVTDAGVKHVMRVFSKHFLKSEAIPAASPLSNRTLGNFNNRSDVVCDEETIERALMQSSAAA